MLLLRVDLAVRLPAAQRPADQYTDYRTNDERSGDDIVAGNVNVGAVRSPMHIEWLLIRDYGSYKRDTNNQAQAANKSVNCVANP